MALVTLPEISWIFELEFGELPLLERTVSLIARLVLDNGRDDDLLPLHELGLVDNQVLLLFAYFAVDATRDGSILPLGKCPG